MEITAAQAAPLCDRTERTLRSLAAAGRIPGARKVGTVWVFPFASVLALPAPRPDTSRRKVA